MTKVTKPFDGYSYIGGVEEVPCWFFEGVQIPDVDFDALVWSCKEEYLFQSDLRHTAHSYIQNNNPVMKELKGIMDCVIETIKENHLMAGFKNHYPIDPWKPCNDYSIKKDLPGFEMGSHLDNRNTKWTFIMNLIDNEESTIFYHDQFQAPYSTLDPIMGPTKKGSGTFYFNHHTILHSIGPITKERYNLFQQAKI